MTSKEQILERLSDTINDHTSHIIVCDLDDYENGTMVWNTELLKKQIEKMLNENKKEDEIINFILKSEEVDYDETKQVTDVVRHVLKNKKKFFINYKKSWRKDLDLLSDVYETRKLAEIEGKLISVDIDEIFNAIEGKNNFESMARRHTLMIEKRLIESSLIKMQLNNLRRI